MLRTANYIVENNLIADEINTTLKYIKKTTGVDVSVKNFYSLATPGRIKKDKTEVGKYVQLPIRDITSPFDESPIKGWFLPQGSYICELNEGIQLGPNDVGYIILRSSLNRNLTSLWSAVWDPNFTTKNKDGEIESMSVRLTVDTPKGVYIEQNARVGQLLVFEAPDGMEQYNGQFQNKGLK